MARRGLGVACATAVLSLTLAASASAAQRQQSYTVKLRHGSDLELLANAGQDVTEGRRGNRMEIVATSSEVRKLRSQGLKVKLTRDRRGRSTLRATARAAAAGWTVWRPYARTDVELSGDAGNPTDNIVTQLQKLATKYPRITKLEVIGHTIRGVPIYAMKVTKDADKKRDGSRPAVLFSATQHAREWLAGEVSRRTLRMFVDNYGRNGTAVGTDGNPLDGVDAKEITKLVDHNELWFVPVANPDGYDYTFDPPNRLWRKNLRDNDGDGQITNVDGVDPNRNFPQHWGYDDEGSSPNPPDQTYRGTAPLSEPETRAFDGLLKRVHFAWNKNDHTFGPLLLWPAGWQFDTHEADEPIFRTIAGVEGAPAIPGFHPKVGSDLYTTNGETNDHAYFTYGTISFTPEGDPAPSGSGFVFPDDEALVQADFEKHIQFSLDLARSAADPSDPESHLGNKAPNFEVNTFDVSYGSPQVVQVDARRDLGRISLNYQINGGRTHTTWTREWRGGKRYGEDGDYWYHRMRGKVRHLDPGDSVNVWFESKHKRSDSFTFTVKSDSNAPVLILAAEDYTGTSNIPAYPSTAGPSYLSYYTDALKANGIKYDVYDIDAMGRKAPDALGVLSHFDAVIWYTGNDNVTRQHNLAGRSDKLPHDTQIAVRDFMNEGGRLLYTGKLAGREYTLAEYPVPGADPAQCDGVPGDQDWDEPCKDLSNDFLQYWLGSYTRADNGGVADDGSLRRFIGIGDPLAGFTGSLDGADSANNQAAGGLGPATHLITSSVLPPDTHPDFASSPGAAWEGAGQFQARTGSWFYHSQVIDQAYKRLTKTIDLTGSTSGALDFWANWNTEEDWDWFLVEAHTVGQDDWTTLPDANGHTSHNTGQSCPAGDDYFALHPFVQHYLTRTGSGTDADPYVCAPGGTTGDWNVASGGSAGYEPWHLDLSAFAGKQVEVSITLISDWSFGEIPGILLDDVTVTRSGAAAETTSFEDGTGGWEPSGAPPGSFNGNDWVRTQRAYEEGAVAKTADSLYFGFGFEGVAGAAARNDLMGRTMRYLLR
jgi:hypothetical protein